MQKQKCSLSLYSNFLIANQNRYSGAELSRVAPQKNLCHDSVSRFLASSNFTPSQLWNQVKGFVDKTTGYVICDDTLLDKRYSKVNELAKKQYRGKEHKVMNGISLINLLWTKGDEFIPIDYRIYQRENDDKTKNDHFLDMLQRAHQRGFTPHYVLMDAWYSSINNLKFITKKLRWNFICNLKSNRQVSMSQGTYIALTDLDLAERQVRKVWLKEYGFIVVCKIVHTNDRHYLSGK